MSTTSISLQFPISVFDSRICNPKPETPQTAKVATWVAKAEILNETPESCETWINKGEEPEAIKQIYLAILSIGDRWPLTIDRSRKKAYSRMGWGYCVGLWAVLEKGYEWDPANDIT